MRRIASVLANRRADKDKQSKEDPSSSAARPQSSARPQPARKASRLLAAVSRSRITVSTEQPVPPLDQGLSSSSSCGSNSIQTPDDDRASPILPPDPATLTPASRKGWNPWANPKKAPTTPPSSLPPPPFPSSRLTPLTPNNRSPRAAHHDTDDDATSDSSSESDEAAPSNHKPPVTLDHARSPIEYLTFLTSTGLVRPFSPCPLQHVRGQPLFPRSCNPSRSVLFRESLESTMHRSRLLRRLQRDSSSVSLSPSDRRMLASFRPRLSPSPKRTLPQPDEGAFPDVSALDPSGTSRGLRAWLARGYFEERTVAWKPSADGSSVAYSPVTGSGFGVWALDVSRALEEMAGAEDLEDRDWPVPVPKSSPPHSPSSAPTFVPDAPSSPSSSSSQRSISPPAPVTGRQAPYKAAPSPLRTESDPTTGTVVKPSLSARSVTAPSAVPMPESPTPAAINSNRRGVRFAEEEDDKEENVPLGYVLRHKKNREEKAQFLQRQKELRAHDEERQKHEAERQRWQKEREQYKREMQAIEEEKRKKAYAEEVIAARARRASSMMHFPPSSSPALPQDGDGGRVNKYHRPAYDPKSKPEEHSSSSRSRNQSSSSSRPGSTYYSPNSGTTGSRPASTYSVHSSMEDVRLRENRTNSRRGSMVSEAASQSHARSSLYAYGWPNVPVSVPPIPAFPVNVIPSMPIMAMPQYVMDMPLLPPNPPFMGGQQFGRRSRSRDSSSSPGRKSGTTSGSHTSASGGGSKERPRQSSYNSSHGHGSRQGSSGDERNSPTRTGTPREQHRSGRPTTRLQQTGSWGTPPPPSAMNMSVANLSAHSGYSNSGNARPHPSRRMTAFS